MALSFDEQEHGYRSGHELLHATIKLAREDQDTVDRLSDIAGSLRPGEKFAPYLTAYPLPSYSHYVIARTWQDIGAPRAGCVLTKSLFIPMADWEHTKAILEIVAQLDEARFTSVPGDFSAGHVYLRQIEDGRRIELVEALFLETRQPIVMFDSKEAEDITLRLLLAIWPNLRRSFAVCTFTLAPRRVANRAFDLLFAPSSARARFGDWPGRKILSGNTASPRHRWSLAMASQLFESDLPSLLANDGLGLLVSDPDADEGALRLSLLWNELAAKVDQAPSAVLGMLDIINSHTKRNDDLVQKIVPVLCRAILQTAESEGVAEAWTFLKTLFGKFQGRLLPQEIAHPVEDAARTLTNRDPLATLEAVSNDVLDHQVPPREVYCGVSEAIAQIPPSKVLFGAISHAPGDALLGLLSATPNGSQAIVGMAEEFGDLPKLASVISVADHETAAQLRKNIVPLIRNEAGSVLLSPILSGVSSDELASIAVAVFKQTGFVDATLGGMILRAARSSEALSKLRSAVAGEFWDDDARDYLVRTLGISQESINWLSAGNVAPERARILLRALIDRTTDQELMAGQRDNAVLEAILNLLVGDLQNSAQQIARILEVGQVSPQGVFDFGVQLLPYLDGKKNKRLFTALAEHAFSHAAVDDSRVRDVATYCARAIGIGPLIQFVAMRGVASKRVGANVRILNQLRAHFRRDIVAQVDDLSERLVSHGLRGTETGAYEAWASILEDARTLGTPGFHRAAAPTLAFALRQISEPASPLIVVTFPVIYAQLLKSGDEGPSVSAMVFFPLSMFIDWDKAKAGRKDLVAAFMHSVWPPSDLLKTADRAGIARKIIQRVRRSHNGDQYLRRLENDVLRAPDSDGGKELKALLREVQVGDDEDWD